MSRAREITDALGGRWAGASGTACCPAHEDHNPSLSLTDGDGGRLLLTCHAGCEFSDILAALRARRIIGGHGGFVRIGQLQLSPRYTPDPNAADKSQWARRMWEGASPIEGTLAERYLRSRGILGALPPSLRYIRDCKHPTGVSLPTLIGKVTGSSGFAIHRTYLTADGSGKARISPAKAMLGPTKGGAVKLSPVSHRLIAAEGIETALSLDYLYIEKPATVLAALSAGGMEALSLPRIPGELIIAPDGDRRGKTAAKVLAERAQALGWTVSILSPPNGADWNDVLMERTVRA